MSARSCLTRSRRRTSSPMRRTRRDDAKLLDELGDVLFQVHFLACCSRSAAPATWRASPSTSTEKLIRRHPHVFGEAEAATQRRGAAQLGRDQADRARARAGRVRRSAREPAGAAVRPQGAAARGLDRVRLRGDRGTPAVGPRRARRAERRARPTTSDSTSSATSCSPRSTSPASSTSTPSWRCARRPTVSAVACRPASISRHPSGRNWNDLGDRGATRLLRRRACRPTEVARDGSRAA